MHTCGHFFESSHAPRVLLFPVAVACAGCFVQGSAALETSLSGANNGLMSLSGVSYSTQFSTAVSTRFLASHGHCCHPTRVHWHAYGRPPQHYQTPPNNLCMIWHIVCCHVVALRKWCDTPKFGHDSQHVGGHTNSAVICAQTPRSPHSRLTTMGPLPCTGVSVVIQPVTEQRVLCQH